MERQEQQTRQIQEPTAPGEDQRQATPAEPDHQEPVTPSPLQKVLVSELKAKTLGQIVANVDAYYRENPKKLNTSVIEVVLRRCTNVCPPEAGVKEKKQ